MIAICDSTINCKSIVAIVGAASCERYPNFSLSARSSRQDSHNMADDIQPYKPRLDLFSEQVSHLFSL
jgi:hypothetical protein